jgi:hypothetical protein
VIPRSALSIIRTRDTLRPMLVTGSASSPVRRLPTPAELICLLAGTVLTIQYAWLIDDGYVYFRYVDNLLFLKFGLVYNRGEYVEGFSSPFWAVLLTGLRALGFEWWSLVRVIGVLSFLAFGLLVIRLNRRMSPMDAPTVDLPLAYLALNYGVLCYFTSGLESPIVQLTAPLFAVLIMNPDSRMLQAAVGLMPMIRHELALPWLVAVVWCRGRTGRWPLALLLVGAGVSVAWLTFRIYYYADLLPNTFYLKDTSDARQGWIYVRETVMTYRLPLFCLVVIGLAGIALRRARTAAVGTAGLHLPERCVMLFAASLVTAYVIRIGGDPRHYRYLAFPFCLFVCAAGGLAEHAVAALSARSPSRRAWVVGSQIAVLAVALGASLQYPPQLSGHPLRSDTKNTTVDGINDAQFHRRHPSLEESPWSWSSTRPDLRPSYAAWRQRDPSLHYQGVESGAWCAGIYQGFSTRFIQSFGLTDPVLARIDLPADKPAHKYGLLPIAKDIARLTREDGGDSRLTVGMYQRALDTGRAPAWVEPNLASLELIERKMLNQHRFGENLRLALTRVPPLHIK